jgi:Tfp pilus assembly protein PilV
VGRRLRDERGESLLELLVAVVIMGVTVVAVVGALAVGARTSDIHRKQATAGTSARGYAETVGRRVAGGIYTGCAPTSAIAPATVGFAVPAGYTASVVSVKYWNGSSFAATCGSDTGLQQVVVQLASTDGRATERATVVVRKPCGTGSSC